MAEVVLDQKLRALKINTVLGENAVLLTGFSGREEISRLYSFQLDLISKQPNIHAKAIVGKPVSFSFDQVIRDKKHTRHFHGYINRFVAGYWDDAVKIRGYRAEVVPFLWFLTRTADCRIFQEMTVPQIIAEVFKDHLPKFAGKVSVDDSGINKGNHRKWNYCVQYRETDFNFISRLMEQEGIYYFFEHKPDQVVLHLADQVSGYKTAETPVCDYMAVESGSRDFHELSRWEHQFEFRPGDWTQTDYDFTKPTYAMQTNKKTTGPAVYDQEPSYEIFDFPGVYLSDEKEGYGKHQTQVRLEEDETPKDVIIGAGLCSPFYPGAQFQVGRHVADEEKGEKYLITSVVHSGYEPSGYRSEASGSSEKYSNTFTCIPAKRIFRPARITPKPVIQGTQTARVTGTKGQEIYTDPEGYGRVKVQFFWDRRGKFDEKSSCWIRVAQNWAGKRWGTFFLPRIGQEVIVAFLEGDPDHPIVVGSVYNHDQMHPYLGKGLDSKHPHDPKVSGIKTNSTMGGSGFNELRFDDNAGKEQVFIHAQHNMDVKVRNDSKESIYGHRHQTIGWEKDGKKGGNQIELVHDQKHLTVEGTETENIQGDAQKYYGGGEGKGGNLDVVIDKNLTEKVGGEHNLAVAKDQSISVDGAVSLSAGGDINSKAGMNHCTEAGMEYHIKGGMKVILQAGMQLSLVGPGGFINIGPSGVDIMGAMVKINSGGAAGAIKPAKPKKAKEAKKAAPTKPTPADTSVSGQKSSYD